MKELNEIEASQVGGGFKVYSFAQGAGFVLIGAVGIATGGFGCVVAGSVLMAGGGWLMSR